MAQIIELLGDFPWSRKFGGRYGKDLFNSHGTCVYPVFAFSTFYLDGFWGTSLVESNRSRV